MFLPRATTFHTPSDQMASELKERSRGWPRGRPNFHTVRSLFDVVVLNNAITIRDNYIAEADMVVDLLRMRDATRNPDHEHTLDSWKVREHLRPVDCRE